MSVKPTTPKPPFVPETPNQQKIKLSPQTNASQIILDTATKPSVPRVVKANSNPFKGFSKIISFVWRAFKRAIFGSDIKKNNQPINDETVSSSAENSISKWSFLEVALTLNKKMVQLTKNNSNVTDPVELQKERHKDRKRARRELLEIARVLKQIEKEGVSLKNDVIPKGQDNITGANCYMNAALQLIESTVLLDPALLNIIKQDLTRKPKETMAEMEDRLFSAFSPISEIKLENLEELKQKLNEIRIEMDALDPDEKELKKTLQEQISITEYDLGNIDSWLKAEIELADAEKSLQSVLEKIPVNVDERNKLNQRICTLKYDLLEREDKILFKWSFLLLLQAKAYGTDEEINKALKAHHRIVFMLKRHDEFKKSTGPTDQQDASAYMELWQNMFEKKFQISSFRSAVKSDGTIVYQDPSVLTMRVFPLPIKDGNFISSISHDFSKKNENSKDLEGFQKEKTKQEALLQQALEKPLANDKQNEIKINGINNKIENLEKKIDFIDNWKDPNGEKHLDFNENYQFTGLPPEILNFQLARFSFDHFKQQSLKNATKLSYSLDKNEKFTDILDLDAYFKPENLEEGHAHYQLTGFVKHAGGVSASSGHYTSYVLRGEKWFLCNDSVVSFVKTSDVPFADAYILSYKRI